MKIIDLLNKMSKDKNYKPTVKYCGETYTYNEQIDIYKSDNENSDYGLFSGWILENILNDEVEVIEENKEIEEFETEYTMRQMDIQFQNKINELVRQVNKLTKESEEK